MADPTDSGIYEIVNLKNGKRYIGSAKNFRVRWNAHRAQLRKRAHHSRYLQASWSKHGEAAFAFRVLLRCPVESLLTEEQAAFTQYAPEFNISPTAGSTLGRRFTEETKAKIAARAVGRKRSPDSIERGAAKLRGVKRPPEHSAHLIGNKHAVGVKHTEEWREATSAKLREQYETGKRSKERPSEYRAKIAETLRQRAEDPEMRSRLREQAAAAWKNRSPEERRQHMQMVRAARGEITDEQRKAISERQKGRSMHPNAASALKAANSGRKLSEEHRKKISENNLRSWTPERKEKQAAAMRAAHARRKAAAE